MQAEMVDNRSGSLGVLAAAFVVAFAVMLVVPVWRWKGAFQSAGHGGHGGGVTLSVEEFRSRVEAQAKQYGRPDGAVEPPPESTVYIEAMQFAFSPNRIHLRRGANYTLSLYAADVMHGVSFIKDGNLGGILMPGTPTNLAIRVDTAGEVQVRCTEYCGLGHHVMLATLIVD